LKRNRLAAREKDNNRMSQLKGKEKGVKFSLIQGQRGLKY